METVVCELRGDEVLGDLDAVVQVPHLVGRASRDKHSVTWYKSMLDTRDRTYEIKESLTVFISFVKNVFSLPN